MIFNTDKMIEWGADNEYHVASNCAYKVTLIKEVTMQYGCYTQVINYTYYRNKLSAYICPPTKIDSHSILEEMFRSLTSVRHDSIELIKYMRKSKKIQNSSAYGIVGNPHTPTSEELEDIFRKED